MSLSFSINAPINLAHGTPGPFIPKRLRDQIPTNLERSVSTDTTKRPARKQRKEPTFHEQLLKVVRKRSHPLAVFLSTYTPLLLIAAGYVLRTIFGPTAALVVVVAGLLTLNLGGLIYGRLKPNPKRTKLDWTSAATYEMHVRERLRPDVTEILDGTFDHVRRLGYVGVHLFQMECLCDRDDAVCTCGHRSLAATAVVWRERRVVMMLGDRLLNGDPEEFAFVLAHERNHPRPIVFWSAYIQIMSIVIGSLICGIIAPGFVFALIAATSIEVCFVLTRWWIELACDSVAAVHHGGGGLGYFRTPINRGARDLRGATTWWQRQLSRMTLPTHPPACLRIANVRRVVRRERRRR